MNNGRDCLHGRQVGKCDTCDLITAELELEKVTAERDALAAQVEALKLPLKALLETPLGFGGSLQADGQFAYRVRESVFKKAEDAINATPQQHLAELRAEAGRAGFVAGANWVESDELPLSKDVAAKLYAEQIRKGE